MFSFYGKKAIFYDYLLKYKVKKERINKFEEHKQRSVKSGLPMHHKTSYFLFNKTTTTKATKIVLAETI